ncbi:conserved hypothetical protein, partial [Streptococcus pneumoniae]
MELVLPNNYVVIDEEEMMYLDGGAYLSKRACQGICVALAMSSGTFIALAGAAVLTKKLINYIPNHSYLSQLDVTYKTPDL